MEDYLEQIAALIAEKGQARVADIAERLSISQASVSNMVKRLAQEDLVHYKRYHGVTLTARGRGVADFIIRRHEVLTDFLELFGLDEQTIYNDVEGMEHHISSPTIQVFEALVQELQASPETVRRISNRLKEAK